MLFKLVKTHAKSVAIKKLVVYSYCKDHACVLETSIKVANDLSNTMQAVSGEHHWLLIPLTIQI